MKVSSQAVNYLVCRQRLWHIESVLNETPDTPEKPHLVGYARVSMSDQDNLRQRDALIQYGVDPRDIFEDTASGRNMKRPSWYDCWRDIRKGDVLVVHAIDRLGRDLIEVSLVLRDLHKKGAELVVLNQQGLDTRTPIGKLIFSVLLALAQWERESIVERTRHGLAVARANGRVGGSKKRVSDEQIGAALKLYQAKKEGISKLARDLGITTQALYRRFAQYREEKGQ